MSTQIAALLKRLREDAGLTQEDIGRSLGVSHSYVHDYERGQRRLDVVQFNRVAQMLGTTLPEIPGQLSTVVGAPAPDRSEELAFVPVEDRQPIAGSERWIMTKVWHDAECRRFGGYLRSIRKGSVGHDGRRLIQRVLAEQLEVGQSFVSKYENGERRIDLPELDQIAEGLGVRLPEILSGFDWFSYDS